MKGLFITATDTDAGKTFCTSVILRGLAKRGIHCFGHKPVASGAQWIDNRWQNDDARELQNASALEQSYEATNPLCFPEAIAPHIAAERRHVKMTVRTIKQNLVCSFTGDQPRIVEGVGGWLVPINDKETFEDLAIALNFPVILVVPIKLGCLNHALLTQARIAQTPLKFAGWIANRIDSSADCIDENIATLESKLDAPLLGTLPRLSHAQWADDYIDFTIIQKLLE
ncbi:MAG: dethiobiotin synthase [Pseudomonadota bacterium]